jgi:hypothetical protein
LLTGANLFVAGGSREESFRLKGCPALRGLDYERIQDLIVEYFTGRGYTFVKKHFEDIDFEKDGIKYFASFDFFPASEVCEPDLGFKFDREIDSTRRVKLKGE